MSTLNRSRPATSAPGVKVLLTTLSLAVTIGGWAWFTARPIESTNTTEQSVVQAATLNLPPLPTLVPRPQSLAGVVAPNGFGQTSVNPAPQVLRPVTMPVFSFPTFTTRSSR
jgi:hypothetical protein